jgi:hypothetical protein
MATLELAIPPTANTAGSVRWRVRLEGSDYVLTAQWNQREALWTLDLADVDSVAIVSGLVLVPLWPLLALVTDARRPPGELMIWQPDGNMEPPTLAGLGAASKLIYYEGAAE